MAYIRRVLSYAITMECPRARRALQLGHLAPFVAHPTEIRHLVDPNVWFALIREWRHLNYAEFDLVGFLTANGFDKVADKIQSHKRRREDAQGDVPNTEAPN